MLTGWEKKYCRNKKALLPILQIKELKKSQLTITYLNLEKKKLVFPKKNVLQVVPGFYEEETYCSNEKKP